MGTAPATSVMIWWWWSNLPRKWRGPPSRRRNHHLLWFYNGRNVSAMCCKPRIFRPSSVLQLKSTPLMYDIVVILHPPLNYYYMGNRKLNMASLKWNEYIYVPSTYPVTVDLLCGISSLIHFTANKNKYLEQSAHSESEPYEGDGRILIHLANCDNTITFGSLITLLFYFQSVLVMFSWLHCIM